MRSSCPRRQYAPLKPEIRALPRQREGLLAPLCPPKRPTPGAKLANLAHLPGAGKLGGRQRSDARNELARLITDPLTCVGLDADCVRAGSARIDYLGRDGPLAERLRPQECIQLRLALVTLRQIISHGGLEIIK